MAWVCIDWKRFHPTPNIIARKKKSSSDKKNKNLIKILCEFMYRFHISHAGIAENDGRIFIYKLNMYSPACSAEVFPPEGDLIGDELAPAQVVENARVGGEVKAQAVGVERLLRFAIAAVDAADAVFSVAEQVE